MATLADVVKIKNLSSSDDVKKYDCFLSKTKCSVKEHIKSNVQDYFAFRGKSNIDAYDVFQIVKSRPFLNYYKKCDKNLESIKKYKIEAHNNIKTDNNISFFDDFSPNKIKSLYKYMPLNRFLKNLEDGELVLVSPKTWRDPYEKKYWLADYADLSFRKPAIYCMCLTLNRRKNEDAAWNLYAYDKNEKLIQIEFDTQKLLDVLKRKVDKIYIGKAVYDYNSPEIDNLYKRGKKGHFLYFNQFNEDCFFNLLRIKRKSYSFENEVRIFVKIDSSKGNDDTFKIKDVDYSSLIKGIRLAPYTPLAHQDCRNEVYRQLQNIECKCIKKKILTKLKTIKIKQSHLYTDAKKIIKIEK